MRIAVLTGLFACALIFTMGTQTSSAQVSDTTIATNQIQTNEAPTVLALLNAEHDTALRVIVEDDIVTEEAPAPQQPQKHVVTENQTLTTIADMYQTSWRRLFDKNTSLENPDILAVGTELVIPTADEQLAERPLPAPIVVEPVIKTAPKQSSAPKQNTVVSTPRGSSSGNGYVAGYCTWYVKNKRPDLPNNLGNAATWVTRAAAQGIATGSTPSVGAVGQRNNHVVYVENVNADGTVTISEMNYQARYAVTTRTLPANYFRYIY